jgi:RecG-like helicase
VASSVVPVRDKPAWLDRAWERLREEVTAGRQAYVVCPRIGEDAATEEEPDDADGAPAGRARTAVRRWPSSTWPRSCAPGRWPGCAWRSCTAG